MKNEMTRQPTHPGAILREDVLPSLDMSVTRLAELLRVSRQTVHGILSEVKPVTPNIALRLGQLIGNGPEIWLGMQNAYDLWAVQKEIRKDLAKIPQYPVAKAG
jgi:addiction module HigA family antidote